MTIPSSTKTVLQMPTLNYLVSSPPLNQLRLCLIRTIRHKIKTGPEDIIHELSEYLLRTGISSSREHVTDPSPPKSSPTEAELSGSVTVCI